MGLDVVTYAKSKKYTESTAVALGAVKGANCTIKSIVQDVNKNNIVTFEWTATTGAKQTQTMTVPPGISVTGFTPVDDTHFKWNFSDGTYSADVEYPEQLIKISSKTGNAIQQITTVGEEGLYVSATGVQVSTKADNLIETIATVGEEGLYVTHDDDKVDVDQTIANAGKALIVGSDGKVTVGDAGVKVSTKTGNDIQDITTTGEEGIYVEVPVKGIQLDGTDLAPDTDGKIDIKISAETDNILESKTDGLYVPEQPTKISAKADNAIENITDAGEEGIYVPKNDMEEDDLTIEEFFDDVTPTTPYHGDENKLTSSDYIYKQFQIVLPKVDEKIKSIFDLASNITYETVDTYADLLAVDTSTFSHGLYLYLVKQDENYPRVGSDDAYYSTIYLLQRDKDTGTTSWVIVGKLNISEKMIESQIVEAIKKAIYIELPAHYEICASSDEGAKVVVADGTLVDADTEIEQSNVVPLLPGAVVNIGDYVKHVDEGISNITKFVGRTEIDVATAAKLSTIKETDPDTGDENEYLAFNGQKIQSEIDIDDYIEPYTDEEVGSFFDYTPEEVAEMTAFISDGETSKFKVWSSDKTSAEINRVIAESVSPIDDEADETVDDKTWSAKKISDELANIKRLKFTFPADGTETTVVSDTELFGNYTVVGFSVKSKSTGNYVHCPYRDADVMVKSTGLVVANYIDYYKTCEAYALLIKISDL